MTTNEYDFDEYSSDTGLDPADRERFKREGWLKMTKGQVVVCGLVFFHPISITRAQTAKNKAKEAGLPFTQEEGLAVAKAALEERAKELGKALDELTPAEKLDTTCVKFKSMQGSYDERVGYVVNRLGLDGPAGDVWWKYLPEPKLYFSTLLLVYPMSGGKVDIEGIRKGESRLVPWRFSRQTWDKFHALEEGLRGNGLTLATQDLRLECVEEKYQNILVTFVGKSIWQGSPGFRKKTLEQAIEKYSKLIPFRLLSTEALKAKLTGQGAGTGGSNGQPPYIDVSATDPALTALLDSV
jgi:hypothetical protein